MSGFYQLLKFHLFVDVNFQCWNFSLSSVGLQSIQLNAQQTYSQFIALKCWSRSESIYFCSCSHISALTLTDLFRHEIRIMLMLHSVARLSLSSSDRIHRLRLSCCRSTYTHGKKPFPTHNTKYSSLCSVEIQSKQCLLVCLDMQFIWLPEKWLLQKNFRSHKKRLPVCLLSTIWYAADDTVCIGIVHCVQFSW